MRTRNPCVRLRRRLLGWKVRFIKSGNARCRGVGSQDKLVGLPSSVVGRVAKTCRRPPATSHILPAPGLPHRLPQLWKFCGNPGGAP
jgi:hypothetical protein